MFLKINIFDSNYSIYYDNQTLNILRKYERLVPQNKLMVMYEEDITHTCIYQHFFADFYEVFFVEFLWLDDLFSKNFTNFIIMFLKVIYVIWHHHFPLEQRRGYQVIWVNSLFKEELQIPKLILLAYEKKKLLREIYTITKLLLFRIKYIVDGRCLFDDWYLYSLYYSNA